MILSSITYEHERTSGTFLGWLSDVGGLKDAIVLLMSPLAAYVSDLAFHLSITNALPAVQQSTGF